MRDRSWSVGPVVRLIEGAIVGVLVGLIVRDEVGPSDWLTEGASVGPACWVD